MTNCSPCCRGILHASPEMLRGGSRVGIQIPCCTLDFERVVWHSEQSASCVTSLSESQPHLATSVICHIFRGRTHSRCDQSNHVKWSPDGNSCISQQEVLDNWRRHFTSVGASSSSLHSFDEYFHAVVSTRFITIRSVCAEGSRLFDAPFSASGMRLTLSLCNNSAVNSMASRTPCSISTSHGGKMLSLLSSTSFPHQERRPHSSQQLSSYFSCVVFVQKSSSI